MFQDWPEQFESHILGGDRSEADKGQVPHGEAGEDIPPPLGVRLLRLHMSSLSPIRRQDLQLLLAFRGASRDAHYEFPTEKL